jgi:outer membrane receptor protein involved in Fe transport
MKAGLKAGSASIALGLALIATPGFAQTSDTDATAQTDAAATAAPQASQPADIVVTGSRIPQPNLTEVSPVTVVGAAEVKQTGTTRVEDLLNQLPQVFADQGAGVANGASGTANVSLRGLGSNRTLVLIDGRRLMPGDPSDPSPDINFIPGALIKRVDVLTGGASSVYGADAVGGVVNFVMDTDFTGFRLDSQYSFYQHNNNSNTGIVEAEKAAGFAYPHGNSANGGAIDVTGVIGASFDDDRGHVVAYAGYRKINPVTQATRDYSACTIGDYSDAGGLSCGGSATSANGTAIMFAGGAGDRSKTFPGVPYSGGTSTLFQVGPNQTFDPGYTPYNYGPLNYFQRPDERYTAGFFAHYDINDSFKPYLEGMFMDDRSVAQIAGSGDFGNTFSVNCDNPLLSAQQRSVVCSYGNLIAQTVSPNLDTADPDDVIYSAPSYSNTAAVSTIISNAQQGYTDPRASTPFDFIDPSTGNHYQKGFMQLLRRNVEGGPRQDTLQHTAFRIVGGMKGDISKAFSYDAYYQFGRTNFAETYLHDFSITKIGRALDVVTDPNSGKAICRSVLDGSDPNCVPWNIFQPGGVTPEALAYLDTPGFQRGYNEEQVASASITGQLGQLGVQSPWAQDGVGINVGVEYRKETLDLNTDLEYQTGDLAGQGAATLPVHGSYRVYEAFAELLAPIVHDSFIYDFSINAGYRYSDYHVADRSFSTDSYKIGADFAPIRSIRFRGAYNRAVRAPNVQEYFAPQRVALDGTTDPCAGSDVTKLATPEQCANTGISSTQYGHVIANPANQYNGLIGGNPDLKPEIADTYTAGIVFQPDFIRGLAITADYFSIKIKDTITGIGADTIVTTCAQTGDPTFCSLVHRDGSGSLWRSPDGYIIDTTQNIGSLKTSGVDVGASYAHDLGGLGSLSVNFNGTYLHDLTTNNGVSEPYDCAGYYGAQCTAGNPSNGTNPKWRHRLRATLTLPDGIGFSAAWRYFSKVKEDFASPDSTLASPGDVNAFDRSIPSISYFDLTMTATIGEHYRFRIGANNILDKEPPLVTSAVCPAGPCNGNTFPVVYDALGRYIFAGVTLDF